MVKCAVQGCINYQGKEHKKFFCFPKDPKLCRQWISLCGGLPELNPKFARICSDHFTENDWKLQHLLLNISEDKMRLKHGAVPSQKLPSKDGPENDEAKRRKMEDSALCDGKEGENIALDFFQAEVGCVKIDPPDIIQTSVHSELHALQMDNKKLRKEACDLIQRVKKSEAVVFSMERIFTKGQIKRLMNPQKRSIWNYEEIAKSITLFSASPVMYQILWRKKFPFPSPSTLRKWVATLKLRPGILASTIKVLAGNHFEKQDRLCVLTFYEIRLKKPAHTGVPDDSGLRPYKYAQMFIIRGLVGEWKQIIYYNFDCMLPGLVVKDIVRTLREINFTVVAVVTGVGPRKLSLWRELQIDEEHPWFEVFDDEKVFVFANVPHLLKTLRNKFIERGFIIDGKCITIESLREMLAVEPSELWVSHDLTQKHIDQKIVGKHNHQAVAQLFSQSVADSLRKCVAMGKIYSPCAIECSDFIQLVDEWLGVFNSKNTNSTGTPYGLGLEDQNSIIASMNDLMKRLKIVGSEEGVQPFQKGILLNNSSLPQFHAYVKEKHDVSYVITNNLNPDDIEHSFGIRKSHGGVAQKPTPLEFKYRLRAGVFANLTAINFS